MNAKPQTVTVRVTRRLNAAPERVFDAWLDPRQACKWLFATPSGKMVHAEADARVGGAYTYTERRDDEDIEHTGKYLAIERPRRIVFTFLVLKYSKDQTIVTINLTAAGSGCELTLTHDGVWADYETRTKEGWNMILDGLAATLG